MKNISGEFTTEYGNHGKKLKFMKEGKCHLFFFSVICTIEFEFEKEKMGFRRDNI